MTEGVSNNQGNGPSFGKNLYHATIVKAIEDLSKVRIPLVEGYKAGNEVRQDGGSVFEAVGTGIQVVQDTEFMNLKHLEEAGLDLTLYGVAGTAAEDRQAARQAEHQARQQAENQE